MTLPLFLQSLLDDLSLQPLVGIHLFKLPVLVFEAGHQRGAHPTEFATSFIKRSPADAVLPAELWDRAATLRLLEYGDNPAT